METKTFARRASAPLALAVALALALPARAQDGACDRACLKELADRVLDSMAAHDASGLPLAREYAATENSVAAAPGMMVAWQTAGAVTDRFYVIDPVSHQLFLLATLVEGPYATLLYGRIRADGARIAELELFENRSRGQGGFQYGGRALANMPAEWTAAVEARRLPDRAALLNEGRSVFDRSIRGHASSSSCVLMENGKVVAENPDVAREVGGGGPARPANPDGSVPIPCGSPPDRPADPKARTEIVDEVQGIVVTQAVVSGVTEPYLATAPTESAFVPDQLLAPYVRMLDQQRRSGKNPAPALRAMPATGAVTHIHRVYDGKLQGQHLLVNLGAPGGRSPWVR